MYSYDFPSAYMQIGIHVAFWATFLHVNNFKIAGHTVTTLLLI